MPLRSGMTELAGFPAWFHDIHESDHSGVVCPDVMSFVGDSAVETNKSDWMGYKKDAEGTVKHGKWQISSFDE